MTYNGETFDVNVQLTIDLTTGLVSATFQSLNPNTELPPDAFAGFLPPEDGTGRGMGYFSYLISPKPNLPTGTQIRNVAVVTFDSNPAITTDQVNDDDPTKGTDPTKEALVTIDDGASSSSVTALPSSSPTSFTVSWSGQDDTGGSGIATYEVFVNDNGGAFTSFQTATTATSATFTGVVGHTYGFYSVATDNVGHVQPTPVAAQTTTTVTAATGSISGSVFRDFNLDGMQDNGEPTLAGVTVFLDLNNNGALDAGEPTVITDASGAYRFTGLDGGYLHRSRSPVWRHDPQCAVNGQLLAHAGGRLHIYGRRIRECAHQHHSAPDPSTEHSIPG